MTAKEYFKKKGRGSQKEAAMKLGFSVQHFRSVISQQIPASPFFASCLKTICPEIDLTSIAVTNGAKKAEIRVSKNNGRFEVWMGKTYVCTMKTLEDAKKYISEKSQKKL